MWAGMTTLPLEQLVKEISAPVKSNSNSLFIVAKVYREKFTTRQPTPEIDHRRRQPIQTPAAFSCSSPIAVLKIIMNNPASSSVKLLSSPSSSSSL
jgi:hypothetical protein